MRTLPAGRHRAARTRPIGVTAGTATARPATATGAGKRLRQRLPAPARPGGGSTPPGPGQGRCGPLVRAGAAARPGRLCTAAPRADHFLNSSGTLLHMIPDRQRKMLFFKPISFWLKFAQGDGQAAWIGAVGRFASSRPHRYPQLVWISRESLAWYALSAGTCTEAGTRCGNTGRPAPADLSSPPMAGTAA